MRSPESGVHLAPLTTLGLGGPARWYARAESEDDVREAHAWAGRRGVPLFVLAGGSNVVIADEGFDGLVLHVALRGVSQARDGDDVLVTAAAGEGWDDLVAQTVRQGLSGLECLSGIPGTVGGTPIQNVGAYGQEVAQSIASVSVFDRAGDAQSALAAEACEFGYRTSRFKTREAGRFIVCAVTFRLRHGDATVAYPDVVDHLSRRGTTSPAIRDVRDAVLEIRRSKGMVLDAGDVDTRSVGSFFTNPVVTEHVVDELASRVGLRVPAYAAGPGMRKVPAAWLLDQAGFSRGYGAGAVGLSSKHPLAIINRGDGSARSVVTFAVDIKRRVAERFGITLVPEPTFVGFGDDEDVGYLVRGSREPGCGGTVQP